jgi:uncharacterized protein YchJ
MLENAMSDKKSSEGQKKFDEIIGGIDFGSQITESWTDMILEQTEAVHPNTKIPQLGRNAPCVCGSGKKYKKCCGKGE